MSRFRTSSILTVAAVLLLAGALVAAAIARRARRAELDVVGEAGSTVVREQIRHDLDE